MKEKLLDEMPKNGKKARKEIEIVSQEGDFEDDDEEEEEFRKLLAIQIENSEHERNKELLQKRERYIRLSRMWVKILEYYSCYLNTNEVTRIAENLYFNRCEDFDSKQLERLENRAVTIIHKYEPRKIPNARRMPKEILKISLIDRRRWIDPQQIKRKHDYYGTINQEIEDEKKFDYLYNKAKELGARQAEIKKNNDEEMRL